MTKRDLSEIPTDDLRLELKRRVDQEKINKANRIKELTETLKKAEAELRSLGASTPIPSSKNQGKSGERQKVVPADLNSPPPGIPSVVDAVMPRSLKKSMRDSQEEQQSPPPQVQRSAASEQGPDIQRCPNCSATPSNWEFNPRDENVYCVCGQLIMNKDDIHGNSFRI